MAHPAIIRTEFASAEDAAKIYGVSLNRVKELQKLLGQFKTEAQKKPGTRKQNVKMRAGKRTKPAAMRISGSRKSRRVA
jgi:hypothetical protein